MKKLLIISTLLLSGLASAQYHDRPRHQERVEARSDFARIGRLETDVLRQRQDIDKSVRERRMDRQRADRLYRKNDELTRTVRYLKTRRNVGYAEIERIQMELQRQERMIYSRR